MNDEKIARLVVDYLLAEAGGMVKPDKEDTSDDEKEDKKKKPAKGGEGQLSKIFGIFEQKLFGVLAPVAIAATVFASATTGMGVFLGAIKILGSTLGLILAPGVMALSALILTLSDYIQDALLPNLESWYTAVLTFAIGGIEWLEKAYVDAANAVLDFASEALKAGSELMLFAGYVAFVTAELKRRLGDNAGAEADTASGKRFIRAGVEMQGQSDMEHLVRTALFKRLGIPVDETGKPIPLVAGQFTERFQKNLRKSTDEMAFQNMPKSQSTSLAGANMAAQMASIQMSPFEREQLKLSALQVDILNRVVAKITLPTTS